MPNRARRHRLGLGGPRGTGGRRRGDTSFRAFAGGLALVAIGVLGAGCAGPEPYEGPQYTGDPTRYESVEAIRDAYLEAGGTCEQWERVDPGGIAEEVGRCSDAVVMARFRDAAQLENALEQADALAVPTRRLVGENWMLNAPDAAERSEGMRGRIEEIGGI